MLLDADLFPQYVSSYAMRFDPERDGIGSRPFEMMLPASLGRAVPKRRAEFAAGRRCACEALRALAPQLATVEVAIGGQREPLFPPGAVGTISHSREIAAAAVAAASRAVGIGLDIEHWGEEAASVTDHVLVPGELQRLLAQTGWAASRVATLAFSAKETLYKCLFPTVQVYFDFQDAEITAIDTTERRFEARLRVDLAGGLRAGETFHGRFQLAEAYVVTALIRESPGAP